MDTVAPRGWEDAYIIAKMTLLIVLRKRIVVKLFLEVRSCEGCVTLYVRKAAFLVLHVTNM